MKSIIAALAVLTLTACASTAPYEHDRNTHARAVQYQLDKLQPTMPEWQAPAAVEVSFSVKADGSIDSLKVEGGSPRQQKRAVEILHSSTPFPPHTEPDPIHYSTQVIFP